MFSSGYNFFFICFDYGKKNYPNELYNVYLDGQLLGVIESKEELENYINSKTNHLINVQEVTRTYCEDERSLEQVIIDEDLQELINNSKDISYYKNDEQKECVDIIIEDGQLIEQIYTPKGLNIEKVLTYDDQISTVEDIYSKIVELKTFTIKGYQFSI